MKLRLENGNFSIKVRHDESSNTTTYDYLPKGLTIADFIGVLVECVVNGKTTEISTVAEASSIGDVGVSFTYIHPVPNNAAVTLFYDSLSGKVGDNIDDVFNDSSSDEGGSDDGGGGEIPK